MFSERIREDQNPSGYAESAFHYLDGSARKEAIKIRDKVNDWFFRYPSDHRHELISAFRSDQDSQHYSAFFELYLHELLLRLGCVPDVHPLVDGSTKHPDFLVNHPLHGPFYLEAVLALEHNRKDMGRIKLRDEVIDWINDIESPDFFINLTIHGLPKAPVSKSKLRSMILPWLNSLEFNSVNHSYQQRDWINHPKLVFEEEGLQLIFKPIPKPASIRGNPRVRLIGSQFMPFRRSRIAEAIRNALSKKAYRYGYLQFPYIVAINVIGPRANKYRIAEALFGSIQSILMKDNEGDVAIEHLRASNGAILGPSGPRKRCISSIVFTTNLNPWTISQKELIVVKHPWSSNKHIGTLDCLPSISIIDGEFVEEQGTHAWELLDIKAGWPEEDS